MIQKQPSSNSQAAKESNLRENLFAVIVLILVIGSLGLAVVDKEYRPTFADLAKVSVGGFIGWIIPNRSRESGRK